MANLNFGFNIHTFSFDSAGLQQASEVKNATNWPVVYLINNANVLYVGETTSFERRFSQHLQSKEKKEHKFTKISFINDGEENKSVILDYEAMLIRLFAADGHYTLTNANNGQSQSHNYHRRNVYRAKIPYLWSELPSHGFKLKTYEEVVNSNLYKFSPYTQLTQEQKEVMKQTLRAFIDTLKEGKAGTTVINGGAGTGKSLVGIKLIHILTNLNDYSSHDSFSDYDEEWELLCNELIAFQKNIGREIRVAYVAPMQSFKHDLQKVFKQTAGLKTDMLKNTSDISDNMTGYYDLVIVDEAHRLKHKKNMGMTIGQFYKNCKRHGLDKNTANQLDLIMAMSKYRVLFYDQRQSVKPADLTHDEFEASINKEGLTSPQWLYLKSQLRCQGGDDFIDYINDIFDCKNPEKHKIENYDFRIFNDIDDMVCAIKEHNSRMGLCRTVAGYAWEWKTKKHISKNITARQLLNQNLYDIDICGHKYVWNTVDKGWVLSKNSIDEIGCIHTVQGYDLNYVGLILGPDIDYDFVNNKIVINKKNFYDSFGTNMPEDELEPFIINAYKTMMVRGIQGCYVYACNKNLQKYLSKFIDTYVKEFDDSIGSPDKTGIVDVVNNRDKFTTHLPFFPTLKAACHDLSEIGLYEEIMQWIDVSDDMSRLDESMFVVRAMGNSMMPIINDGDYCVFTRYSGGSRNGEIVLVEGYNIKDYDSDNIACTIKKYHSEKRATEEGWEHTSIELIPLNQDFEPFKLDPDDKSFKVLGILKKVIRK